MENEILIIQSSQITYGQCGHFEFDKMTDQEIEKVPNVLQGRTELHGIVRFICCEKCFHAMVCTMSKTYGLEG
jgi:hypothetical protein